MKLHIPKKALLLALVVSAAMAFGVGVRVSAAGTADINGDGHVDVADLSLLLSKYGTNDASADVNNDGTVNINDLSLLLTQFGTNVAPASAVIDDATASGGKALKLNVNATATKSTTTKASSAITVFAKGEQCEGAPSMVVKIDSQVVATTQVTATTYTRYTTNTNITAGTHTIAISYTNEHQLAGSCDRSLTLDKVEFTPVLGDTTRPSAPTLTAVTGDGQVTLNWTAATDNVGVHGYAPYKNGVYMLTLPNTARTYTVTGLTNGTSYAFRIVVTDDAGNWTDSNTVNVTPVAATTGVPASPTPQAWAPLFDEDFTTAAALGQFPGTFYAARGWQAYRPPADDTSGWGLFDPSRNISVANGMLTSHVYTTTNIDPRTGKRERLSATPYVKLPTNRGGGQTWGQLYGRYSVRMRAVSPTGAATGGPGWKVAFLLWPVSNSWSQGEIDFPEGELDSTSLGFSHCVGNPASNCARVSTGTNFADWHWYTIEWTPGKVHFFIDGRDLGGTTSSVPNTEMFYALQSETWLKQDANLTSQPYTGKYVEPPADSNWNVQIDRVVIQDYIGQ
jgi:chitodextrinase